MRPAAQPAFRPSRFRTARPVAAITLALGLLATGGAAQAAIHYVGGTGTTVYGVAPYGAPVVNGATTTYIPNNLSGFTDILTSPGGGFLTANPVIANNIYETPHNIGLPLYSFQVGGGNGNGPFGAAQTFISGPNIAFGMQDFAAGGGSASYMISTWTANFTVDAGGFDDLLGNFLAVGGQVTSPNAAVAVSLISHYYLNGIHEGDTAPLVLAAANNGNFQALGGSGAVLQFGPNRTFRGLASNAFTDNFAFGRDLVGGDNLSVITTLTAYADPASFDTIDIPLDLLDGIRLPDFAVASGSGAVPEPATWVVMILGFFGAGAMLRRRAAVSPG